MEADNESALGALTWKMQGNASTTKNIENYIKTDQGARSCKTKGYKQCMYMGRLKMAEEGVRAQWL